MHVTNRKWFVFVATLALVMSLVGLVGCESKEAREAREAQEAVAADIAKAKELADSGHEYAAAAILEQYAKDGEYPEAVELLKGIDLVDPVVVASISKMSDETLKEYMDYLKTIMSVEEKEGGRFYTITGYKTDCGVGIDRIQLSKDEDNGGYECMAFLSSSAVSGQDVQTLVDELISKNGLSGASSLRGDSISGLWSTSGNDSDGQIWTVLFSESRTLGNYISVTKTSS